ncbi:MAG: four-carbon acid sugar kinase family protein [Candidatus Devosia phytovorans]|uniref:Four-carbon acid sugar kinase family protein n=1 Tax=Candidatus Devosia phytovorans TaxID=3121372 RepID=A0AAJ5VSZ3_9HYPH|nr:four-carbon acid sugar kinase family protein [Devosia sp.]WEK03747.1 MAG: four-carbon acid sugar kinase family protein [Devosia sp.]
MPERAIIADDLTGALDAAAPFAMRGISTAVALDVHALPEAIATGARVIGVSTDSREIAPDAAREAVRLAVAQLPEGTQLFKKVDSRLKGNIAAELDAMPHERSLVVPAIPAFGRWMRDGRLGGFGVAEPIAIAERLGAHADVAAIPDIEDQTDIERALSQDVDLLIGARSLAEALAKMMAPDAVLPDLSLPQANVYCVIGSTDPITLRQLQHLRESNPDLVYIPAPNGTAPDGVLPYPGRLTVIQAVPGDAPADGVAVGMALGQSLARLSPAPGSLLIFSGGATAQVILGQLGIRVLELVGEAQPGLPLARAGGYTVITKSGGFGDREALTRLTAAYRTIGSPVQHHVG